MRFLTLLTLIVITSSCNPASFRSSNKKSQQNGVPSTDKPTANGPNSNEGNITNNDQNNNDPNNPATVNPDPNTTSSGPGIVVTDGTLCVKQPVDLNVMLLLDTTGSMTSQAKNVLQAVPALLTQIQSFKAKLGDKIVALRVGAIGFIDQSRFTIQPMEDLNALQNQVNQAIQGAGDWDDDSDSAEGGFWAFFTGLDLMKQVTKTTSAINVSFIMTDAWSHDGAGCGADCDAGGNRTFNISLAEQRYKDPVHAGVIIYDWSPSSGGNGSGNFSDGTRNKYGSPRGQWDYLRNSFKQFKNAPNFAAGMHIADKVSNPSSDFVTAIGDLANELKKCN